MTTFLYVDPESLVNVAKKQPENGRGAWTTEGVGDDYQYHFRRGTKVGDEAEKSLAHWAVSVGVWGIQARLHALGYLEPRTDEQKGNYGKSTRNAVRRFQDASGLSDDGTVGRTDARALWGPVLEEAEAQHGIPDRWLKGLINHESALDPGAVGYYIFYPDYRGVDRGMAQINSKAHPEIGWIKAFQPWSAIRYAGERLRKTYNQFTKDYPKASYDTRWQAAVCSHNSPLNAHSWLQDGKPNETAAKYVAMVQRARF